MWLLHPLPQANGNYATLGMHYAALGLPRLKGHNFRYPSVGFAVISQYISIDKLTHTFKIIGLHITNNYMLYFAS